MLEEWLNKYYDKFGEDYPLLITTMLSEDEIIEDIRRCIDNNVLAEPLDLDPELDY